MKKYYLLACLLFSGAANAGILTSDAGFDAGDTTVTFNEVVVAGGTAVTNQFAAFGVTFATDTAAWWASNDPDAYSNNPNFAGRYVDSFTGGPAASIFDIFFTTDVDAAGAFFEFNISNPAATFTAYLNGNLVETFDYNNTNCCSSTEFLGFEGITFDQIRISDITATNFIMDTLSFSPAGVSEPSTFALFGLLAALGLSRRKAKA